MKVLEDLLPTSDTVLTGDINININERIHNNGEKYLKILSINGYSSLVKDDRPSCIDDIF